MYNILAIDGGGIRGIIPAGVLLGVEKEAYRYATEKGYNVPKYQDADGKDIPLVHLKDMFDMMAGTSTGSIISAALAYPNPEDKELPRDQRRPWYFMQEIMAIYTETGDQIFVASRSSAVVGFFIFVFMLAGCGALGYAFNHHHFNFEKDRKKIEEIREKTQRIELTKDQKVAQMSKMQELTQKLLLSQVEEHLNKDFDVVDEATLTAYEDELEKKRQYNYISLAVFVFLGFIFALVFQKVFAKLSKPKYNRASLEGIMESRLGAYPITETLSDELLITAYDYNSQEPRFYSKYFANQEPKIYNVPVGNATGASSAAPTFFDPKQ